jgi:hypothetical protein
MPKSDKIENTGAANLPADIGLMLLDALGGL